MSAAEAAAAEAGLEAGKRVIAVLDSVIHAQMALIAELEGRPP